MRLPVTPRTTLLRELRDEVRALYPAGRVVLAVDADVGGGSADFADGLAEVFAEAGTSVFRASLEGFARGRTPVEASRGAYIDAFDIDTLRRVLIDPFRAGGRTASSTGFQLAAWDAHRDAPLESRWVTAPADAVLVVDGAVLLHPLVRGAWNWSVHLDVPIDIAAARAEPGHLSAGDRRRLQDGYEREANPRAAASAIVDNADPERPRRVYRDFC